MTAETWRRESILRGIEEELGTETCVISIITSPFIDHSMYYIQLSYLRDVSYVIDLLRDRVCREVAILYSAVASDIRFAEHLIKRIKSMGVEKITTFVLDLALSVGALLPLLSDKVYLTPWAVIGTLDPLISYTPTSPKESVILRDLVEQIMISVPKDGIGAKAQVMHALAVSGIYYEYELALKSINYVEKLLLERLEGKIPDDKLSELIERLLNKVEIHDQPMNAYEFASLVPFAEIVSGVMLKYLSRYYEDVLSSFSENNSAIIIEDVLKTHEISVPQQGMNYFRI